MANGLLLVRLRVMTVVCDERLLRREGEGRGGLIMMGMSSESRGSDGSDGKWYSRSSSAAVLPSSASSSGSQLSGADETTDGRGVWRSCCSLRRLFAAMAACF